VLAAIGLYYLYPALPSLLWLLMVMAALLVTALLSRTRNWFGRRSSPIVSAVALFAAGGVLMAGVMPEMSKQLGWQRVSVQGIHWLTDLEAAQRQAKLENKPLMVD